MTVPEQDAPARVAVKLTVSAPTPLPVKAPRSMEFDAPAVLAVMVCVSAPSVTTIVHTCGTAPMSSIWMLVLIWPGSRGPALILALTPLVQVAVPRVSTSLAYRAGAALTPTAVTMARAARTERVFMG